MSRGELWDLVWAALSGRAPTSPGESVLVLPFPEWHVTLLPDLPSE